MASCSRQICVRCCSRVARGSIGPSRSSIRLARVVGGRTLPATTTTTSWPRQSFSSATRPLFRPSSSPTSLRVLDKDYPSDDYTNLSSTILSKVASEPQLPQLPSHPLRLLNEQIHRSLRSFQVIKAPSPVVTVEENFGQLGIAEDHPGRSPTDTYYLNRQTCLRTHTSAHEVQTFAQGISKWTLTADVFRRDEIDASHYPIFHQMEGACIYDVEDYREGGPAEAECEEMEKRLEKSKIEIEDLVDLKEAGGYQSTHLHDPARLRAAQVSMRHLKATLNNLVLDLFGDRHAFDSSKQAQHEEPLKVRWIAAEFPFTTPSYEVEVLFRGKWLEILGCGVVMDKTLVEAGVANKIGWAFGLGLERIAMVLFQIPDIRLFWSKDPRFLSQFAAAATTSTPAPSSSASDEINAPHAGVSSAGGLQKMPVVTFKPYSKFPPCYKDVSFWLPSKFHENDLFEVIRDIAGDLTEDVVQIDDFIHPKTQRRSKCFRINYRSMDRNLENEEINILHNQVTSRLVDELHVELR